MRYALARKNIGKRILSRLHVCFSIPLPRGVVSLAALSSFKSLKEQPPPPIGKCPRRQQNASVLNASHFLTRELHMHNTSYCG